MSYDIIAAEETIGEFSDNCTMETDTNGNPGVFLCVSNTTWALYLLLAMGLV